MNLDRKKNKSSHYGVTVLNALAEKLNTFKLEFAHYDWSSGTYKTSGKSIPDGGLEDLERHDAILFGVNCPPEKPDWVIIRENSEGNGTATEVATEVGREFPEVQVNKMLVDAMTTRMVLKPETLDTIVASNLHADNLLRPCRCRGRFDRCIVPTSNLESTGQHPSMFTPMHNSAFDISGKGAADPVTTFWTAAEKCAKDLEGKSTTKEVTTAVVAEIQRLEERT
ncbi:hypothetical protein BDV28DRAFT_161560 [Aspergillus coremiiformis]|uniref:Isopropylmalate dehydrogenase-like domain-containing protein n=1 Tax=Aspergillus coremiiformis TaxID=138285 RepID=A0A5N6YRR5_9EURO|nr:hypothetical protein BDV28DRAFT_161560 [Aspergillus coremiiformis]